MDGIPSTSGTLLKDTISKNYQELCNAIDCKDLFLTLLHSNGIITQGLLSEVKSIHDNLTKAVKILDFLKDCRTDADFSKFVDILKASGYSKAVDLIQEPVTLSSTTSFGYQGVVAGYIERQEPQKQALEHLTAKPNRNTQITFPVVVLHGFGGNGKSQVARRLVQILTNDVNDSGNVTKFISVWINAVSEASVIDGFRNFANVAKDADVSTVIKGIHKEMKLKNIMLVFDDSYDFEMLKKFLPLNQIETNVRVIITAHSEWDFCDKNIKNIPVANFTVTEFQDFVSEAVSYPISDREFKQLEGYTGRIPAILSLVCKGFSRRFKRDSTYTISKHFEKYGDEIFIFSEDGKCIPGLTASDYKKSARIVVEQQLECMENRESDDSPELMDLVKFILNSIAYCDPVCISEEDFFVKHPQILRKAEGDNGEIRQAIGILEEFGWIRLVSTETYQIYSMHACYQIGLKSQLDEGTLETILHGMIEYVAIPTYIREACSHLAAFWSYISNHSNRSSLLTRAAETNHCLIGLAYNGLMDDFKSLAGAYQDQGELVHALLQDETEEDPAPSCPMFYLFNNATDHELVKYFILEIKTYYGNLEDSEQQAWIRRQLLWATIGFIYSKEYKNFILTLDTFDLNVNECLQSRNIPLHCGTLLHSAADSRNLEFVQLLIDKGANINEKNVLGETPLLRALTSGEVETAKFLVENGASIHEKTDGGETALHSAVYMSNLEVVKFLIEKGANINEEDDNGETPLHIAVCQPKKEEWQEDIEEEDEEEDEDKNFEIVKFLVENGADIYGINRDGDTAIQLAAKLKKQNIVDYLISINQSLHHRIE